jgi:YfiH family protein
MILETIHADWPAPKHIVAFSTTRQGGVSSGSFESLNLGMHVGDEPNAVLQNREILVKQMKLPAHPTWLAQVHGTTVLELPRADGSLPRADGSLPRADGSFTSEPGVVCAVMTADCLPLLLCDAAGTQVAAIHVGWRGLAAGIVEHAVALFACPANQILAWAGPAISPQHFEIGVEVRDALGGPASAYRAASEPHKCYADLWQLTGIRLEQCGVGFYHHSTLCTYADSQLCFSHRRDQASGRQASLIYIAA